jgi:hypothetical protein
MARHDPSKTPPEKRRAQKGTALHEGRFRHTAESLAALEVVKGKRRLSDAAATRYALEFAATHAPDDE